jgi:hypothetical protein
MPMPSGQQPNKVSSQWVGGQPSFFLPFAGDTPSAQQPNSVSSHVEGCGQPKITKIHHLFHFYFSSRYSIHCIKYRALNQIKMPGFSDK